MSILVSVLNRRASQPVIHRTVTRHRHSGPPVFLTETPELRRASVATDSSWGVNSDIYLSSDEEDDDHRKLSVEEVLKELYQRECRKLGVCPVGAFLRAPVRQSLVLKNYSLGPKGAAALAVPLLLDSTVTSVDLEGNGIGAEGLRSLTGALLDSNYITDINLANNKIGHSGVGLVKQLLLTNFYVVHINLSGNHFSDSDAEIFAQVLKENKHLKELILSKNNFGELGGKMLGLEIAANDSLELLDLSWNHIRGKGAVAIAHAVKENVGLKTLRLAFNGLGADGGSAMGDALANNRTLRELDISNNRILDGAVKDLASGIASNDSLELLYMGVNPFTLPSALAIVEAVRRNETGSLQLLNLKDVSVTEEFLAVATEIKESRDFTVVHGLKSKIRLVRPDPPERLQDPDSVIADSESVSSVDQDAGRPSTGKVSFSDETEKHDERTNDLDESSSNKEEGLHQEEEENSHDSAESLSDDDTPADNNGDKSDKDATDDENVSVVSSDTGRERDTVPSRSGSSLPGEADEQLEGRGDPDENPIVTDDDRRNSDISEGLVSPTPDESVSNADGGSVGSEIEIEVDGHAASPGEKDGGLDERGSLEDIREESPEKEGQ